LNSNSQMKHIIKILLTTMSKPNCCYFYCCFYKVNPARPWYLRTLCAQILTGLAIGLGILIAIPLAAGLVIGLVTLILSVITYVTQYIIIIDIFPNKPVVCGIDHSIISNCALPGMIMLALLVADVLLINAFCVPIYMWLCKKDYYLGITFLGLGLVPVYFFGPELGGIVFYQIFSPVEFPLGKCDLTSWWGFMNLHCFIQGLLLFLMMGTIELVCVGVYYLGRCIIGKYRTYENYFSTALAKSSEAANYGTIPSEYDSITIDTADDNTE